MYCRFTLFLSLLFYPSPSYSQPAAPPIEWQHEMGGSLDDIPYDVIQSSDQGFLLVGGSTSSDGDILKPADTEHGGNYDYWILKIDPSSNFVWKKHLGGTGSDLASSTFQSADGGYIVGGSSSSNDVDVSGNHGDYDFWIVKLSSSGTVQWTKSIGGSDYEDFGNIHQTNDGGMIICGGSQSNNGDVSGNHGSSDFWLVKTDVSGNILWQKTYGGSGYEKASDVRECADGGYILAGFSESNDGDVTSNHGDYDGWIVKTDANGSIQWQHSIGGSDYDVAHGVVQLPDGNYVINGYTSSDDGDISGNHGDEDAWAAKLDNSGNVTWSYCYGGSSTDEASSLEMVGDSSLIMACYSKSGDGDLSSNYGLWDYWLIQTDLDGVLEWQKNFGGTLNDVCYSAKSTNDNGYILAGYSESSDNDGSGNHGKKDFWAVKLEGTVGINGIAGFTNRLNIYPQPVSDILNFQIPGDIFSGRKNSTLEIYNPEGIRTKTISNISNPNIELDCSNWESGLYFFKLKENSLAFAVGKFMVQ